MERVENGKDGKKYIALPNEISRMSDEQIDHWAEKVFESFAGFVQGKKIDEEKGS